MVRDLSDLHIAQNGENMVVQEDVYKRQALDKDKVKEQILKAIDGGKTELDLEAEDCYLKPTVYSTDENLIKQRDQSNAYLGVTVTFDFSDRQEVVNKDVIKNWLTTDENGDVAVSYTHLTLSSSTTTPYLLPNQNLKNLFSFSFSSSLS